MKWRRGNQFDFLALTSVMFRCPTMARTRHASGSSTMLR